MGVAAKLAPAVQAFLGAGGRVESLRVMADGHAGLTFGFEWRSAAGPTKSYILKMSPEGVPRSGSTDVFRQAALLRTLSRSGFPAPDVPWASEDESVLGAPFIIMERLPGQTVIVWEPAPAVMAQFDTPSALWTETARLMGALHRFDWRTELSAWETPTDLERELDRWTRLLRHMQDEEDLARARELAGRLGDALPSTVDIGLVHGDLQPGNVLFDQGAARGLIDWDLAAIGPYGMDVGWMLMMADEEGWAPDWRPIAPPSRAALLDAYWTAGGTLCSDLAWYHAFSNFRMAAISGLNLKLHRDGRRHDPIWERFAASTRTMLTRALALLQHARNATP